MVRFEVLFFQINLAICSSMLQSEEGSSKHAKLHSVAVSNNWDHTPCSF